MKKRTPKEIKVEILKNSIEKIKPTRLMYATNISYKNVLRYIEELKEKGLIDEIIIEEPERRKDKRTKINYVTTTKGITLIREWNDVINSIE